MKTYTFICHDDEDNTTTSVEYSTEDDAWIGYDGPAYKFFNFLKGCGFVFGINDELGVYNDKADKFVSCYGK